MNQQFENFLKNCVAKNEKQQPQLVRLKVLQRQGLLNDYNINSMLRGGSLLSIPNPSMSTSMCKNEKQKAIIALNNIFNAFKSSASSTLA